MRLTRLGDKGNALYRIVVVDARVARDGKYIEKIGHYNPNVNPAEIVVDVEKAKKCNKEELIQYWEVPDVGGKDHWTDGTPEFFCELTQYRKAFINSHRQPVRIPPKGEMVVCGYLFTKEFAVVLDSIDHIATVRYDLTRDHISVLGAAEGTYRIYKK